MTDEPSLFTVLIIHFVLIVFHSTVSYTVLASAYAAVRHYQKIEEDLRISKLLGFLSVLLAIVFNGWLLSESAPKMFVELLTNYRLLLHIIIGAHGVGFGLVTYPFLPERVKEWLKTDAAHGWALLFVAALVSFILWMSR